MGRAKGSKNKPKDTEAPAGEGHNSRPQLTDAERQALHFRHCKEYADALAIKKKGDADLKNVCKRIKAEGGTVSAVKLSISLDTPEGEAAMRAKLAEMEEVAKWNGVGVQVDMFADEREPAEDRAYKEGHRAGLKGDDNRPPYDPSVPQHAKWLTGYSDGNAVLASEGIKQLTQPEVRSAA